MHLSYHDINVHIWSLKKSWKNQEHKNSSIWSRPMHWDLSATKYIMCEISLFDLNLTASYGIWIFISTKRSIFFAWLYQSVKQKKTTGIGWHIYCILFATLVYGKINANVNSFPRKYVVNRIEATKTQSKSDCPVNIEEGTLITNFLGQAHTQVLS